tara:strand:+ start:603 stop:992 length:390 start_codon:yes stop_codon:yes gene_type:complete
MTNYNFFTVLLSFIFLISFQTTSFSINSPSSNHHQAMLSATTNSVSSKNQLSTDSAEIIVIVDGMVCAFCAKGIETSFNNHNAVKAVKIDLENQSVLIKTKWLRSLSDKAIKTIITDAGYDLSSIKRQQ